MTDRPILFSGAMVRAILDGRKTQTRRVLNPQPPKGAHYSGIHYASYEPSSHFFNCNGHGFKVRQRFDEDDRLWVRETVACGACAPSKPSHWSPSFWRREQGTPSNPNGLWYQADGLCPQKAITERGKWIPGIHMPRWASRLTLTVTDVLVQRLQEISEEDALAEGVECWSEPGLVSWRVGDAMSFVGAVDAYRTLWDSINAARPGCSWSDNPWICAISFSVQRGNIDQVSS